MRRGLMGWSSEELPESALDARRARLQAAMAREGLEALVLYTNSVRPSPGRGLIARADALALAALAEVDPAVTDAGVLAGLVEKHARLGGAEEVFVAIAPDLDRDARLIQMLRPTLLAQRFAMRASVAYKGA